MLSIPKSRRWLLPALVLLVFVLVYRSFIRVPESVKTVVDFRPQPRIQYGIKIPREIIDEHSLPRRDASQGHVWPQQKYYYNYSGSGQDHAKDVYLEPLLQCRHRPNPHTDHIRLPNIIQNVSHRTSVDDPDTEQKFNPTIIALPPWSPHQYLLVSRVVTAGLHQESLLCEADSCYANNNNNNTDNDLEDGRRPGERDCTPDDLVVLGEAGGLRCATSPMIISIPPTPAERCEGSWSSFPDIPGFHDPRIFWSGKGEPLIMVNSASRYACAASGSPICALCTTRSGRSWPRSPVSTPIRDR